MALETTAAIFRPLKALSGKLFKSEFLSKINLFHESKIQLSPSCGISSSKWQFSNCSNKARNEGRTHFIAYQQKGFSPFSVPLLSKGIQKTRSSRCSSVSSFEPQPSRNTVWDPFLHVKCRKSCKKGSKQKKWACKKWVTHGFQL